MNDSDSSRTARFGTPESSRTSHGQPGAFEGQPLAELEDAPQPSELPAGQGSPRNFSALSGLRIDVRLVLAGVVLVACAVWIFFIEDLDTAGTSRGDPGEETAGTIDSEHPSVAKENVTTGRSEREARASRVCSATMSRVFQGGSVTVADVDGWNVDIALLRVGNTQPLDTHHALERFVARPDDPEGSKFVWKQEPLLASVDTSDTLVTVRRTTIGEGRDRVPGVVLSFSGAYVDAYFKEEERRRYYHIATSLMDELHATHGAIYARCFDRPLHALGSWFRGIDVASAATSLIYFMGMHAKPLHVARPYYQLPGDDGVDHFQALKAIEKKTALLDRHDLAMLLGKDGGNATGKEFVVITFPFQDGNRASRASRSVARVTSLGR